MVFDIASQDLAVALEQYSVLTGQYLLYESALLIGRRSEAVRGRFDVDEALRRILANTGLMAEYTTSDTFVVRRIPGHRTREEAAGGEGPPTHKRHFYGRLQRRLSALICARGGIRPGGYRAAMQLWIGADGAIRDARLLASTGDPVRDRALLETVRGLQLEGGPPSTVSQPLTVLVDPATTGKTDACMGNGQGG